MARDRLPPKTNGLDGARAGDADQLRRFLHYGHIFSSAVQEILETKYLNEVSPYPLTVAQFHLLKLITLRGRHQVGEVAEFLGVSSPAVSKNIDKLAGLGLVVRRPSKGDRRVTLLTASDEGRQLVSDYEALKAERLTPVLSAFEPAEIDQLSSLLERFSVRLFQSEETGSPFCLRCAAYGTADCSLVEVDGDCPYQRSRANQRGPS